VHRLTGTAAPAARTRVHRLTGTAAPAACTRVRRLAAVAGERRLTRERRQRRLNDDECDGTLSWGRPIGRPQCARKGRLDA
ncbi:hypothetical protein, partial [Ilumatobacter sp.]|uniref:hypothetical protein n=1 Tax=Ilumatobacter sp. TaxID=1967498 RepID=UPI003296C655